jgi:hypothetical protein
LKTIPEINLDHLYRLTDDTGIIEHAVFAVPNYGEGYATDDNARALIVAVLLEQLGSSAPARVKELAYRYLAFLWFALEPTSNRFRNSMSYERQWLEDKGSEDSHGRALWGLGTVLGRSKDASLRGAAGRLFEFTFPVALGFRSPRAWAYALLGLQEYLDCVPGDRTAVSAADALGHRLLTAYQVNQPGEWKWFEGIVTYSNARLPEALIRSGARSGNEEMVAVGLESLDWLVSTQRCETKGHFVPVGTEGFYSKKAPKARFDQQPVEACAAISACLQAYRVTGTARWREEAWSAFNWFLGRNDLNLPLYDPTTGGCRDGLHPDRANENQGAESTLSFLTALLEMRELEESDATEKQSEKRNAAPVVLP